MVAAWYLGGEQNLKTIIEVDDLKASTGILYLKLNIDSTSFDGDLQELQHIRNYSYTDTIDISPENLADYEIRVNNFHTEHLHPEEEIRMVLKGTTYFDVRDKEDQWIRIELTPGDLLILPPRIYHRLTLNEDAPNVVLYRLFKERPIWTSVNRHEIELN